MARGKRRGAGLAALVLVVALAVAVPPAARASPEAQQLRVAMSDGVELFAELHGEGPLVDGQLPARPTIVEVGPYGDGSSIPTISAEYNHLYVHIRGTGASDGSFDALGPRSQLDVAEVLGWACRQPWSDGHLGLWGFSASAIMAYNSMHLELPCVDGAVLGAGTHELYRDLLYPGGVPNYIPGLVVITGIGGGALLSGPQRLERDPASSLTVLEGMLRTGTSYLEHPSLDSWWVERGMRGTVNDFPILMVTGFFDVESRGPFQVFQELHDRQAANRLMVIGAHDGVPAGTNGAVDERLAWFDRFLRDVDNGVDDHPAVSLWLADGSREDLLAGRFVRVDGDDWPIPGTTWRTFHLGAERSGSGRSLNDGTLRDAPGAPGSASFVAVPSLPTATDPHTIATVGVNGIPLFSDMAIAEPLGLGFSTEPFTEDLVAAGPASVELTVSTTAPETDVLVVLSDVDPSGVAHPMATGRLRTSYPDVDLARSLVDEDGDVVQPYNVLAGKAPAAVGTERRYAVELWPIGNRFRAGHRLRLHLVSPSLLSIPGLPALTTVRLGGEDGARLHLPVLPAGAVVAPAAASVAAPGPERAAGPLTELPATGGGRDPRTAALLVVLAAVGTALLRRSARA